MSSIWEWIRQSEALREEPVLRTPSAEYRLADLEEEIRKYTEFLQQFGSLSGKKVGLIVPPVFPMISLSLAVNRLGGIIVPVSPMFRNDDLGKLLEFLDPHVMFSIRRSGGFDFGEAVQDWAGRSGKECLVFLSDTCEEWEFRHYEGPEREPEACPAHVISCTSGSTGLPKSIMVTVDWFKHCTETVAVMYDFKKSDQLLSMAPVAGNFGLCLVLGSISKGLTVYVPESFDFPSILRWMEGVNCNKLATTPSIFKALALFARQMDSPALQSLKLCGLAGENITPAYVNELRQLDLPDCQIRSMYGLSELAGLMYIEQDIRESLDFGLIPGIEYRLAEPGQEESEIAFKVPHGFKGYFKRPDLTEEACRDGFFYTGDLVSFLGDKIRITGRIKDIIKKGGQLVHPGEVEHLIAEHPAVKQVAVVPAPHRIYGEQIVAYVRQDGSLRQEELLAYLHDKAAGYKLPDAVEFVDDFPVSQGKLDRISLRKRAAERYGSLL